MACTNFESGSEGCDGGCGGGCSCDNLVKLEKPKSHGGHGVCFKCKIGVGALSVGNQSEPLCRDCLHANLLSKFKTAVKNNGLVSSSDRVLVAFSGGPSSRAALELLKEIRLKAQSDADASKDRCLNVFGLGAVFVDERIVLQLSPLDAQTAVDGIRSIFVDGGQESIPLHVVPLACVFDNQLKDVLIATCNTGNGDFNEEVTKSSGQKLGQLFQSIQDSTGKEDLLEYLRMQAIQKVAQVHGYTKVVLGLCTTRIAGRVIAETTKGRGYSLSGDIQYLDTRWPVAVALPLRDCVAKELALFCHFSKFKTTFVKGLTTLAGPCSSLNNLAHTFVTLLQEENSSREHAIVRTATKLKSFKFNEVDESVNRRRRNPQLPKKEFSQSKLTFEPDLFCPICCAPVNKNDMLEGGKMTSSVEKRDDRPTSPNLPSKSSEFRETCCPSCRFQIFPEEDQMVSVKYELLPREIQERGLSCIADRQNWSAKIESYLLPEVDDSD